MILGSSRILRKSTAWRCIHRLAHNKRKVVGAIGVIGVMQAWTAAYIIYYSNTIFPERITSRSERKKV